MRFFVVFVVACLATVAMSADDWITCMVGDKAKPTGQIQGTFAFDVSYMKTNNEPANVTLTMGNKDVDCASTGSTPDRVAFLIKFENGTYNLSLSFDKKTDNFEMGETQFMYMVTEKTFPDAQHKDEHGTATWTTSASIVTSGVSTAYQCLAGVEILADQDNLQQNVTMHLSNAKLEPFHYEKTFASVGQKCEADKGATTNAPSTTLMPTPGVGNWTVHDGNNTCIMMDAGIRMWFNETGKNTTTIKTVPKTAGASGNCHGPDDDQTIALKWQDNGDWTAQFWFSDDVSHTKQANGTQYNMYKICLHENQGPPLYCTESSNLPFAKTGDSYQCLAVQNYPATGNGTLKVELTEARIQAYLKEGTKDFGNPRICAADNHTNDIVPIIVGACLAALVVIVLIAYLIGRARAKRSTGYESV